MFKVPILIVGFNRPDLLLDLIKTIRGIKPSKVYLAIDGPRTNVPADSELVEKCRLIVNEINWNCELKTLFREKNLGCGKAVSEAIDWAFADEDELIILEDDLRPSHEFFEFCRHGLELYRENKDVMSLSGYNWFPIETTRNDSLSAYPGIWGWATWKSKWKIYNFQIGKIRPLDVLAVFRVNRFNPLATFIWMTRFLSVKLNRIDTWDYQFAYFSFVNKKLHLVASTNQILNVGFDARATHTLFKPKDLILEYGNIEKLSGIGSYNKKRDQIIRRLDNLQVIHSLKNLLKSILSK